MGKPERNNIKLFRKLGEHSGNAFDTLYQIYAGRLLTFISSYLAYEAGPAEDVLVEVMETLWSERETIATKADPERWMYKIAKNRSLAMRRVLIRHRFEALDDYPGLVSDTLTDSELERDELEGLIWEAVEKLTAAEKEVFLCKWLEGLSSEEIAKRHGVSERTVNNQMTTARKKIGEYLAIHLDPNDIDGLKKSNQ